MPPVGFEHTISAGERPKTYALDRAATGTGDDGHWVTETCRSVTLKFYTFLVTDTGQVFN
jgi:hypothetical protein